MARRPAADILDILREEAEAAPRQRNRDAIVSSEVALKLVVAIERLQAFKDQAGRKAKAAEGGGGSRGTKGANVTEKWRFRGFIEGVDVAQHEVRELMGSLLDVEPEAAEALMRKIAAA